MKPPFTAATLKSWGGEATFRDGCALHLRGAVKDAKLDGDLLSAKVFWGNRTIETKARILKDSSCESLCPCPDNVDRGLICPHVIAAGMAYLARATDPELDRKLQEEERHAQRLKAAGEEEFFRRKAPGAPGARPCKVLLGLAPGWERAGETADVAGVRVWLEWAKGGRTPIGEVPTSMALGMGKKDDNLMFVLEEIAEGRIPSTLLMGADDFIQTMQLYAGRVLAAESGDGGEESVEVESEPLETRLAVELDRATGALRARVEGGGGEEIRRFWTGQGRGGLALCGDKLRPVKRLLPLPLRGIYRRAMEIPREKVPHFLKRELPALRAMTGVRMDAAEELFEFTPGKPSFTLHVKGSGASLSFRLGARYGDGPEVEAGRGASDGMDAVRPDPEDLLRYWTRNPELERAALRRMERYGVRGTGKEWGLSNLVGVREVRNFIGSAVPALRRQGWKVEWEGRISGEMEEARFATPVVRISPAGGGGWFDVEFEYDDGEGGTVSAAEVARALNMGESWVERGGKTLLLDTDAIRSLQGVFRDCASRDGGRAGAFRLAGVYAGYAASSLRGLDGVDVEAPADWLQRAEGRSGRLEGDRAPWPDPKMETYLRPYQKEGVRWLRSLEKNGFGGILADEMGLGKTLQTLTWLAMSAAERKKAGEEARPALIVCPTSLVENWAAEAARFTPWMKVGTMTGKDRADRLAKVGELDLAVTSYALMRRDIELYEGTAFSAVVLDEAQHIKNRETQNARSAKRLHADHRLVLTGTPIENGVSDLWSIMDFLMPGYMGSQGAFRESIEQPIREGGDAGEEAQWRLRHKLGPFLLRRLKKDVAKELPPKIERTAFCQLTADQKAVYTALLKRSQERLADLVEENGFQRSKFEILQTLLRLRQVCCHTGLLELGVAAENPSGKMDLFFELLDEAVDAGHRILVFSQFVKMLQILKAGLDRRGLRHCYLDGATQNRLDIVREFNTDAGIPVFLISLKAGGTGLNLTGADMVIHFDPWWNPAVENQATDRAYRIGQKRSVYSIKLITKGTVEERVLELQRRKQALYDATLAAGGGADELANLTWEDVKGILSM